MKEDGTTGGEALAKWREKLDFLQTKEAEESDPQRLFQLKNNIKEARAKIQELENESRPQASALSKTPRTLRPLEDLGLIGRDDDFEWLKTTVGDRLLVGQPGSGKTYLAWHLARAEDAFFLVSRDETRIAAALRSQRPDVIIVDDAHSNLEQVDVLLHLRAQGSGGSFSILVISWPADKERVAQALGSDIAERELELLSRRDIVTVIRQTGLHGSDELVSVLADQARNKPGLAVTLSLLCMRDWRKVVEGEALRSTLTPLLEDLVGKDATPFLAVLSVGGSLGMPIATVQSFLGYGRSDVWRMANDLAAGGVIWESRKGVLSVQPSDLRSALLRHVFFGKSIALPGYWELLDQALSFVDGVQAVLDAAHRGASVPAGKLRERVRRCEATENAPRFLASARTGVWRSYAALGEAEARWALESYPGDAYDLVETALRMAPEAAIPLLFRRVTEHDRQDHGTRSQVLNTLKRWIEERTPDLDESLLRRQQLVRQVEEYSADEPFRSFSGQMLTVALSPRLEWGNVDPCGDVYKWGTAVLGLPQVEKMYILWKKVGRNLRVALGEDWGSLANCIASWAFPGRYSPAPLSDEALQAMRGVAEVILNDVAAANSDRAGVVAGLARLARKMNLEFTLEADPLFDVLYPELGGQARKEHETAVANLAEEWMTTLQPSEVAERVAWYESEARRIGDFWHPPGVEDMVEKISSEVVDPVPWLSAFVGAGLRCELVFPILRQAVLLRTEDWVSAVDRCFDVDALAPMTAILVLSQPRFSRQAWQRALATVSATPQLAEKICSREQTPVATQKALLARDDWKVAVAAAVGVWLADPRGEVPEAVASEWRTAILRANGKEDSEFLASLYWIEQIYDSDPELTSEKVIVAS